MPVGEVRGPVDWVDVPGGALASLATGLLADHADAGKRRPEAVPQELLAALVILGHEIALGPLGSVRGRRAEPLHQQRAGFVRDLDGGAPERGERVGHEPAVCNARTKTRPGSNFGRTADSRRGLRFTL